MFRLAFNYVRSMSIPFAVETFTHPRYFTTRSRRPSSSRIIIISASVGVVIGAGYGTYTQYKINKKRNKIDPTELQEYPFFKTLPDINPTFKVINEKDTSNLKLVLFQYRTCPFCCKVRTFLDYHGISYDIVEVDAVLRQAIKWSDYKKVPILVANVGTGYQQLYDSTAIMSILETYLQDKKHKLQDVLKFYPRNEYVNADGKPVIDILNKYFIMKGSIITNEKDTIIFSEERKWRQWADSVLVHVLSPNAYRTLEESFQSFNWFAEAGYWRENFPTWECFLMINVGAVAMWLISKNLKKRHGLKEDVRESLYDAANQWTKLLSSKGTTFLGGTEPNLADLSVFGVLSSIEGCQAFKDLRQNTNIGEWYDATKKVIDSRKGQIMPVKKYLNDGQEQVLQLRN